MARTPASPPPTKRGKSETLSLRLDPKTKFALEFVARIRGQSITTVVERAIKSAASDVRIESSAESQDWMNYWDASDGVRTIKILKSGQYPTTYEEDELIEFTECNWEFFYHSSASGSPRRVYIDIIWPDIDEYLAIWRSKRHADYWAAGHAMKAALVKANVASPDWPRGTKAQKESYDLNDDIPF